MMTQIVLFGTFTVGGMFTANTMSSVSEALGMTLPGKFTVIPCHLLVCGITSL